MKNTHLPPCTLKMARRELDEILHMRAFEFLQENSYKGDGSPGMVMGIASDARGDTNTYEDRTDEYKLDNERGLGSTPNNSNVDYMGFRTMMKPSVFLKLAKPLGDYRSSGYQELVQKIKSGEGIGSPFLSIEIPDGWEDEPADFTYPTRVTGHEGRHRMNAILELEGDVPVEVHLWGRFESSELRRRYITDEMFDELEKGLISETGRYIVNPFLSIQR